MMPIEQLLTNALVYAAILNGYLLLMMRTTSPRVWGYADYPEKITENVPSQTPAEKRLGVVLAIPFLLFTLGYPVFATLRLKASLGSETLFGTAFTSMFLMAFLAWFVDLVLLDWLIISKITPDFIVIPGTSKADYKDLSNHYRAQARALPILAAVCLVFAGIITVI